MTAQSFALIPFPAPYIPEISITGQITRRDGMLHLRYSLNGEIGNIFLPFSSAQPERKGELWKNTCFECFLSRRDQPEYWEINISPSGDWNVFHMDAYRRVGFREEMSVQMLKFEAREEREAFILDASFALHAIISEHETLDIGVTAIIQAKGGKETYWALTHLASQADFHLKASFLLALEGQAHPSRQSDPGG